MHRFDPLPWRNIACRWWVEVIREDIFNPQDLTSSELSSLKIFPSQAQTEKYSNVYAPVTVSLLAVVVLRCVLGLWTSSQRFRSHKIRVANTKYYSSWRHIRTIRQPMERDRTYWPFWRYLSQRGVWSLNWRTVEEVPRADAKERQRPRSGSARALPFVWDFAYGGPAGDNNRERSASLSDLFYG